MKTITKEELFAALDRRIRYLKNYMQNTDPFSQTDCVIRTAELELMKLWLEENIFIEEKD